MAVLLGVGACGNNEGSARIRGSCIARGCHLVNGKRKGDATCIAPKVLDARPAAQLSLLAAFCRQALVLLALWAVAIQCPSLWRRWMGEGPLDF